MATLRVGTRRSRLALTQTGLAMDELVRRVPGAGYELVEITTTGDRITDRPLRDAGGKGLFLKELDEALLEGRVDCAVHSLKDVPTELARGTVLAAVLERADPRDVLVTRDGLALEQLRAGCVIGTTSLRRQAQALAVVRGASTRLLRGNVETRLAKIAAGDCDATFLAASGLARLGIEILEYRGRLSWSGAPDDAALALHGVVLDASRFVPAPGQGTLAITTRQGDRRALDLLAALDHQSSRLAALAERAFARMFGGGCHLPLGAWAERRGEELILMGVLISPDGQRSIRDEIRCDLLASVASDGATSNAERAERAGQALANRFFERGAKEIVALAEASA